MDSPDTPADSQGYLIQVGRPPQDGSILESYRSAAAEHGVKTIFPKGGEATDVIKAAEQAMEETNRQ